MEHGAPPEPPPPPVAEPPPPPAAPANAGPPIVLDDEPQQNIDRNLVHKNVIEMFPDLDLTEIIQDYGHMTSEGLASLIIDRMAQIPKKRGTKRKATDFDEYPADNTVEDSDTYTENSDDLGDLLIDKFLATLIHKIKSELRQLDKSAYRADLNKRNFIMNQFTGARANFIDQMLRVFNYSLVPTSIACFFAENNFSSKLQKLAPGLSQNFWLNNGPPMQNRRKPNSHRVPAEIWNEFERYTQLMRHYQEGEYASLLTADLKLTQQYNLIRWERTEPEERIECLVCYDKFPLRRITYCTAPTVPQHAFFADQSSMAVEKNKSEPKMDKPGTSSSNAITLEEDTTTDVNGRHEWSIIDVGEEGNADPSTHPFCRDCIRGQAQAATEQQPLAEGGVGLCCMVPNCKNPILYSDVRPILSREICKKLDERMMQENVAMALLSNLERCKRCNYAVEMEVDKTVDKVFHCLQCDAKFCRICQNDWDDDHFGISCEELEQKLQRDRKDRNLEKQLNEAVIRKCPRCGVAFMKDQGCNKMTCRCGMTSCYICRAEKIDYTHFCQHIRDPRNPNWKCTECTKTCLLYEDAAKKDEQLIAKIRQDAAEGVNNPQEEPNTSNATAPAGPNRPQTPIPNQQPAVPARRGRRWDQPDQPANVNNAYQLPAAVYVPPAAAQLQMEQPYGGLPGQGYEQFIQEARNAFENIQRQRQANQAAYENIQRQWQQANQQANQNQYAPPRPPLHHQHRPFVPPRNPFMPARNGSPPPPFPYHPPYAPPAGNANPVPPRNIYQHGNAQLRDLREYFPMPPQRYDVPHPPIPLPPPPLPPHQQNYAYPEAPPPPLPHYNQQQDYGYPELADQIPLPPPPMPNNNNRREFPQQQQPPQQPQIGQLNAFIQQELEMFDQHLDQIFAEALNEVRPAEANGNNNGGGGQRMDRQNQQQQ